LVPHHGERYQGNQEARTRQIHLGVLIQASAFLH
jgi:hypothetical protein